MKIRDVRVYLPIDLFRRLRDEAQTLASEHDAKAISPELVRDVTPSRLAEWYVCAVLSAEDEARVATAFRGREISDDFRERAYAADAAVAEATAERLIIKAASQPGHGVNTKSSHITINEVESLDGENPVGPDGPKRASDKPAPKKRKR